MQSSGGSTESGRSPTYHVGDLVVDVGQQRVWRGADELALPQLSFAFLVVLIEDAPNVVSFDSLIDRVWAGAIVSPETVTQRVKVLREALGDDPHAPRYVGAVRGRGYRLLARAEARDSERPAEGGPAHASAGSLRVRRWRLAAAGGVAALLAAGLTMHLDARKESQAARLPLSEAERATIAVLPFGNLSAEQDTDYFSDGLTEELLNQLTLMPELQVVARTSTFRFKGSTADVRTIGSELGVRHLLEGTVRKQGEKLRVTAQLVDAKSGYRLWSESFDRQVSDVFSIQDEIALAVARNLKLTLANRDAASRGGRMSRNWEAIELYLRGKHLYQSWNLERIDKGIELFDEAIRIDPSFAAAYVAEADAIFARSQVTATCCDPHGKWMASRRELLRRALELDPENADAIASRGLDLMMSRDFEAAGRELHRAEAINPNGELVLRNLNFYYQGVGWPPERGIEYARHQFRLDPLNVSAAVGVASAYWQAFQLENALAAADRAVELDPSAWFGHWMRTAALSDMGRYEESIEAAEKAIELSDGNPNTYIDLVVALAGAGKLDEAQDLFEEKDHPILEPRWRNAFRACALVALGRNDEAVEALELAYRENDGFLHEVLHYRILMPLHDNPRFKAIVSNFSLERRVQHTRDVNVARQVAATTG